MCLAVPARVEELRSDYEALVELAGARVPVRLDLVENVKVGDYVIVHAGFAIEVLDEEEARKTAALFEEIAKLDEVY